MRTWFGSDEAGRHFGRHCKGFLILLQVGCHFGLLLYVAIEMRASAENKKIIVTSLQETDKFDVRWRIDA